MATLDPNIASLQAAIVVSLSQVDQGWAVTTGIFVFVMQLGFTMLEGGSCRTKNLNNILLKNFFVPLIANPIWYLWGFALAFGDSGPNTNPFIGNTYFALSNLQGSRYTYALVFYQWTFQSAASTIISGAMAERTRFSAYAILVAIIAGWIYPVVVHWQWSTVGWLSIYKPSDPLLFGSGMFDYSGDGAVHLIGGTCALLGAFIIGPRKGRFDLNKEGRVVPLKGHSVSLQMLGTFLLWFGWYGFNAGSTGRLSDLGGQVAGIISVNTGMGASMGGLSALVISKILTKTWDIESAMNGSLAGLVSITSGSPAYEPWAAMIIGIVGGAVYYGANWLITKLKIDDPVAASPIHLGCAVWGLIATGLFAQKYRIEDAVWPTGLRQCEQWGLFMGGGGRLLGAQLVSILVIFAWTALWIGVPLFIFNKLGLLRVDEQSEVEGVDRSEHGVAGQWDALDPNRIANPLPLPSKVTAAPEPDL
jgi:Amt family ammonium transporter